LAHDVTNRFAPKQQPTTNKTTKKCCLLIIILLYNIFSPTFVTDLPSVLDTRQPSSLSHLDPPLSLHKTTKQKTNDRAQHQNNVHEKTTKFLKKNEKKFQNWRWVLPSTVFVGRLLLRLWSVNPSIVHSGTLSAARNSRNTMNWHAKSGRSTCSCIPAGRPVIITPRERRGNEGGRNRVRPEVIEKKTKKQKKHTYTPTTITSTNHITKKIHQKYFFIIFFLEESI
jgi:hypothetical protein